MHFWRHGMKNEYGAELDSNGYARSVIADRKSCYICRVVGELARHEVFHGPFRRKSKAYGLWINLCPECHYRLHNSDGRVDLYLKKVGQRAAMETYHWTTADFISRFGKNYI